MTNGYHAFILDQHSRQILATHFPPKYPSHIGHHITYKFPTTRELVVPNALLGETQCKVVGYAEADGIEALVVAVAGSTERPDGKIYHVTWSLDPAKDRKPVHSNEVIAAGFDPVSFVQFKAKLTFIPFSN